MDRLVEEARVQCATGTGVNNWCIINEGSADYRLSMVCLRQISLYKKAEHYIDFVFENCKDRKFTKVETTYLNWLLHKSIWKHAFLTKKMSELNNLGMVFDTNLPAEYIIQANLFLRYVKEHQNLIKRWYHIKSYCNPYISLWLSHHIRKETTTTFSLGTEIGMTNSNHSTFTRRTNMSRELLVAIVEEKLIFNSHPMMQLKALRQMKLGLSFDDE